MIRLMLLGSVLALCACGPTGPETGAGGGGGATGGGAGGGAATGGGGGVTGGGGGGSSLTDAQRVAIYCEKTRLAGCAAWFTSQQQCVDALSRTPAALCDAKWQAETDCLSRTQATDWTCTAFGEPTIAGTICRDEYGFGSYCRIAVASPDCYFGACTYNSDCPGGASCNDKTKHCFKTSASCGGLPCTYNADCPTGFTCNDALGQCVRN